jgi:hypothetical protein
MDQTRRHLVQLPLEAVQAEVKIMFRHQHQALQEVAVLVVAESDLVLPAQRVKAILAVKEVAVERLIIAQVVVAVEQALTEVQPPEMV